MKFYANLQHSQNQKQKHQKTQLQKFSYPRRFIEFLKCALPDKFVAGCIIAKVPLLWKNFATTFKHKRQEISVENLIVSLDVEEKARAKDATRKERATLAPT
jgi:hypothetical protein